MSDDLLALIAAWGAPALGFITFLSCIAVPIPASLAMLAAGAFAASGDLTLVSIWVAALIGAVLGDFTGFGIAWVGGRHAEGWIARNRSRTAIYQRAATWVARRGALAVFLSRWLVSALGPYVNMLAGVTRMSPPRFVLAILTGETVWVSLYIGVGYSAGGQLEQIAATLGNVSGLIASVALAVGLGWIMVRRGQRKRRA